MTLPELKITVYSDYICPFCYLRHQRLRDSYDLKINWCFLEIHPETSAKGEPIDSLNYPSAQWQKMQQNLERIAKEENIPLSSLSFITTPGTLYYYLKQPNNVNEIPSTTYMKAFSRLTSLIVSISATGTG